MATKNITELGEDTKLGLDVDGDGKPDFHINLKTIGMAIAAVISMTIFYMQITILTLIPRITFSNLQCLLVSVIVL